MRVNTIVSPVKWHELRTSFATKCRLTKYVCTRCPQVSGAFLMHYYRERQTDRQTDRERWGRKGGGDRERVRRLEEVRSCRSCRCLQLGCN
jgi:hypothetical protein